MATPDELRQWFPEDFTDGGETPTQWLLNVQEFNDQSARKWADRTRMWINAGISLLLAGIAVGVVPSGHISPLRWAVIVVAWVGVAAEASWLTAAMADEPARLGLLLGSAAICTSGGAMVAAGFAATARNPDGEPATWWAVALAVAAMPCWLAASTDARFSHGRVRFGSPVDGARAVVRAASALLAPAVFGLALWSVVRELAQGRQSRLAGMHPGVAELLPEDVSLGAHHRAWARCTASHVTSRDELAELLHESGPSLAPDGQPGLDQLWERLVHSPRCAVQVVDSEDPRVRFGYFVVYPLLGETARRIRSGEITADRQFESTDLAGSAEAAAGWFIAVVWAPGARWTRRSVLATLVDALAASQAGDAQRQVFARPYNQQSRSLMKKYRLTPLTGQADGIWITPR